MKPVGKITGTMVPLPRADVDTDQIIPQKFLKRVERTGYGEFLFSHWAHYEDGSPRPDFIFNNAARRSAKVLVAGPNFGCGSSREHAVWAIQGWGIEAVVAPSVGDIFANNAANCGLLTIELPEESVKRLLSIAEDPAVEVVIDLSGQTLRAGDLRASFDFDPDAKASLLAGVDRIGSTLRREAAITRYETERDSWLPSASIRLTD